MGGRATEFSGGVYSMSGQIARKEDPDSTQTYDAEWDYAISKDTEVVDAVTDMYGELTLDTDDALDQLPQDEPGAIDVEGLFGQNLLGNREFFARRTLLTNVNGGKNYNSGDSTVMFTDLVRSKVRFGRGGTVDGPHTAMLAMSSPDLTNTTSTVPSTPTNDEWMILSYIDEYIDEMLSYALGITGGSSVDPYQEVSFFISRLLEGKVYEQTGGTWVGLTYRVFTKATWDITMRGRRDIKVLSG